MLRTLSFTIALALMIAFCPSLPAANADPKSYSAEPITCALLPDRTLGLADSVAVAMLGVELSQQAGLNLLERAEVERLLQERSLQLAFSAEGVAERRALGVLLKVRLLVILRPGERMTDGRIQRWIEMAICDTESGLRVLQDKAIWNDAAPQDCVKSLAEGVKQARQKLGEKVKAIVAAPPFVSDDLLHWYDAYQDAYPRFMVKKFMATPGLQVVELAEARALLQEERLTASGAVRRPIAAFFVSGRYRNTGFGEERTVALTLELRRGEERVAQVEEMKIKGKGGGEAAFLERICREWTGKMTGGAPAAFAPKQELAELRRSADVLEQLGDNGRALGLIEAALLLAPEEYELHGKAAELCGRITDASFLDPALYPDDFAPNARRGLAVARRGCEHLESWLAGLEDAKWRGKVPRFTLWSAMEQQAFHARLEGFWLAGKRIFESRRAAPEVSRLVSELGKAKRNLMLALYERMAERGQTNVDDYWTGHQIAEEYIDGTYVNRTETTMGLDYILYDCNPIDEPLQELQAVRLRALNLYRKMAGMIGAGRAYHCETYATFRFDLASSPAYQDFLKRVAAISKDENWQKMIESVRRRVDKAVIEQEKRKRDLAERLARKPERYIAPTPRPTAPDDDYHIVPIPNINFTPVAWIPAGRADLIASTTDVYIMHRPGELTPLHHLAEKGDFMSPTVNPIRRLAYDGRYGWIVQQNSLMVFDPSGGPPEHIGLQHGLPPGHMEIAPLAPGRVCVVGATDRAWCATVDYRPGGQTKVDVFHEARLRTGDWKDSHLAFTPAFAATLRDPAGKEPPRVLVGRYCEGRATHLPLLLDPQARTVIVVPQRISSAVRQPGLTEHDGSAWWIEVNADLEAMDGISWSRRNQAVSKEKMEEAAIKSLEARGKKIYNGEPLKPGQKLQSEPVFALGLSVEEVQSHPAEEFSRLIRFGAPTWRPEVIHNNTSNSNFGSNSYGLGDEAHDLVGFLDGRGYVFSMDCWWHDAESGRMIKLKGPKGFFDARRHRLFRSSLYGLVFYSSNFQGYKEHCVQFVPTFAPERVRARAEDKTSGRETLVQKPYETRPAVVRLHPDWRGAPDAYTTVTTRIDGEAFALEPDAATTNTVVSIHPEDQTDPEVRSFLRGVSAAFLFTEGIPRWPRNSNMSRFFRLWPEDLAEARPPRPIILQDAQGRPLAGCEVTLGYTLPAVYQWRPDETRYLLGGIRADAAGRIQLPEILTGRSTQAPDSLKISHPDYGAAEFLKCHNPWFTYGERDKDYALRLPTAPRGSAEARNALRGQVVDQAGKPVPGAAISCSMWIEPNGAGHYLFGVPAACDAEGRFSFYPLPEHVSESYLPKPIMPRARFVVKIADPRRRTPPLTMLIDNTKDWSINLDQDVATHRFVFQDENGRPIQTYAPPVYYRCSAEQKALGERMRASYLAQGTGQGQESAQCAFVEEATPKRLGWYDVRPRNGSPLAIQIAADSPRDIIVKLTREQLAETRQASETFIPRAPGSPFKFVATAEAPPATPDAPSITLTVIDAMRRPVAGAEAEINYTRSAAGMPGMVVMSGAPNRNPSRAMSPPAPAVTYKVRTDAAGKIRALRQGPPVSTYSPYGSDWAGECTLTHPDYGVASCNLPSLNPPANPARPSDGPPGFAPPLPGVEAPPEIPEDLDAKIILPMMKRGAPEDAAAVHGRLLDPQGRAIVGARVSFADQKADSRRPGMPAYMQGSMARSALVTASAVSDAAGRFSIAPILPEGMLQGTAPTPGGIPCRLAVAMPESMGGSEIAIETVSGPEEKALRIDTAPRRIRITFRDTAGKTIEPRKYRPILTRDNPARQPQYGYMPWGSAMNPPIYDCRREQPWPESFELAQGSYRIDSLNLMGTIIFKVDASTPESLVLIPENYRSRATRTSGARNALMQPGIGAIRR